MKGVDQRLRAVMKRLPGSRSLAAGVHLLVRFAGKDGYSKVDQLGTAFSSGAVEAGELGLGGAEAGLESFNLAEPAVGAGLGDAVAEVVDDLDEAGFWRGSTYRTGQRMQASLN
jgi:hypothetical protein